MSHCVIRLLFLISEAINQTHTMMISNLLQVIPINLQTKSPDLQKNMSAINYQMRILKNLLRSELINLIFFNIM